MGFLDKLQTRIELFRLEQRYTRRKNRAAFISEAQYVDGEYVYNHPDGRTAGGRWGVKGTRGGLVAREEREGRKR